MSCDQQNNNRDCALFSIANATELAFKGGPGTVRWGGGGGGPRPPVVSGVYALRYLYGPIKLDWFTYYRTFQRSH